jgi:release factor glutamine methyltransferase
MPNEPWTIKKLLDWTTEYFKKYQTDNPHLEAEILLARAINVERIKLYIDFEKEPDKNGLEIFKGFITRRAKGEPAAYITGNKHFMSLNFIVTPDVLIPRPETELLVENTIEVSKSYKGKISILDIGTGSGAIAISLAKFIDNADIYATDTSAKALEIATQNAKKHDVESIIKFIEADLFPKEELKFDIIVSNPPYIKTSDISSLQPEIRNHEPISALNGGPDGLDYYRRILEKAGNYLKEGGYLLLEIGADQSKDVIKIINDRLKLKNILIKKDMSGLDRVVIAS